MEFFFFEYLKILAGFLTSRASWLVGVLLHGSLPFWSA